MLEDIAGVGAKRRQAILKYFETVDALRNATADEIAKVPKMPRDVAERIYAELHRSP